MPSVILRSDTALEYVQHMGSDWMIAKAAWVSTGQDPEDLFKLRAELSRMLDIRANPQPTDEQLREQEAKIAKVEKHMRGVLTFLMNNRHGTPFECGGITVRIDAPIMIWREWMRHRVGFSYNETSGRYTVLQPIFYVPGPERGLHCLKPADFKPSKPGWHGFLPIDDAEREADNEKLRISFQQQYDLYEERLAKGYDNGLAREHLPVAIYSPCYVTCNPRSIMHFLELRTDRVEAKRRSHPLWELDRLSGLLEDEFKKYWPITHELWNANGRQAP